MQKRILSSLERKRIARFDKVKQQMHYSLSRLYNIHDLYMLQIIAQWQIGTDMIMRSPVLSEYSRYKALISLFRLTSLNELYKYNYHLHNVVVQTELFV